MLSDWSPFIFYKHNSVTIKCIPKPILRASLPAHSSHDPTSLNICTTCVISHTLKYKEMGANSYCHILTYIRTQIKKKFWKRMSKKWSIMEEYLVVTDCVHLVWPKAKSNFSKGKCKRDYPRWNWAWTPLENGWITGKQYKLLSCTNLSNEKDSVLDVTFSHILQVDDSTSVSVNN